MGRRFQAKLLQDVQKVRHFTCGMLLSYFSGIFTCQYPLQTTTPPGLQPTDNSYTPHFLRKLSDSDNAFTETCKAFPQCTAQHVAGSCSLSAISNRLKVQWRESADRQRSSRQGRLPQSSAAATHLLRTAPALSPTHSTHSSPKPPRLLSWL